MDFYSLHCQADEIIEIFWFYLGYLFRDIYPVDSPQWRHLSGFSDIVNSVLLDCHNKESLEALRTKVVEWLVHAEAYWPPAEMTMMVLLIVHVIEMILYWGPGRFMAMFAEVRYNAFLRRFNQSCVHPWYFNCETVRFLFIGYFIINHCIFNCLSIYYCYPPGHIFVFLFFHTSLFFLCAFLFSPCHFISDTDFGVSWLMIVRSSTASLPPCNSCGLNVLPRWWNIPKSPLV